MSACIFYSFFCGLYSDACSAPHEINRCQRRPHDSRLKKKKRELETEMGRNHASSILSQWDSNVASMDPNRLVGNVSPDALHRVAPGSCDIQPPKLPVSTRLTPPASLFPQYSRESHARPIPDKNSGKPSRGSAAAGPQAPLVGGLWGGQTKVKVKVSCAHVQWPHTL